MNSDVICWENPPSPKNTTRRRYDWTAIAAQLDTKPGQWAVVAEGPKSELNSLAAAINSGRYKAFRPAGVYRACTRSLEDGTARIYAQRLPW